MGDKYYIPTIDEFYVGFEYEELTIFHTNKGWHTTKDTKWESKVFKANNYLESWYLNQRVIDKLFLQSIRVKYLNREDIESLGFSFAYEQGDGILFGSKNNDESIRITWDGESIIPQNITHISKNRDVIFHGYIKNKSELIKLLKQLGIKNDESKS